MADRISLNSRLLTHGLLATCLLFSQPLWATDADKDALPDEWETANGHDPAKADYSVTVSGTTVSVCTSGNCNVQTQFFPIYGGYQSGGYCKRPIDTTNGIMYQRQNAIECEITGARSIRCRADHQIGLSASLHGPASVKCGASDTYSSWQTMNTVADIGHFSASLSKICAMTTRGVQCWNIGINVTESSASGTYTYTNSLTLTDQGLQSYPIDPDGDGVTSDVDAFPLDASESVDTDNDGIGNNADMDDDGDGVPDYIDADPLNAAINTEKILLLDSNYRGSSVRENTGSQ